MKRLRRTQVTKVLNVLLGAKSITQTFNGKYSTQKAALKDIEITVKKSFEGPGFWLIVGHMNPPIENLESIFVDDVSVASILNAK